MRWRRIGDILLVMAVILGAAAWAGLLTLYFIALPVHF